MSWTCEEEEEEEDPWFTFWVPGTPLVCFQWLPPSPFAPPTLLTSAKTPLTLPPPPPNFLATPLVAPITRSSSQPLTPSFHPLASRPNCCPLSKHFPSSLSFSRSLRPTAVNAPRTVVLSVHLSSKPTRLSPIQGSQTLSLSRSLYPLLCLSGSLSRSPREVKYSQLLLRSGRTATRLSEQTEELWTCEADGVRFIWGPTQVR